MRTRAVRLVVVVVVALAGADGDAQKASREGSRAAFRQERAFAARLRNAVRAQNREAVATLVRYPARVSVLHRPFPVYVADRAALLQMYDLLFTPQLRCAIVMSREPSAAEPSPKYGLLLARGVVSMGGGRVVAERSGRGMLITRLSSFGDTSTRGGKARQVTFDGTRRKIELAGRVTESGADAYVLAARRRDVVEARIEAFPDRTLALRVTRVGTDRPLQGEGQDQDQRSWRTRASVDGEYLVEVVRRAGYCDPPTIPYLLTLTLNP